MQSQRHLLALALLLVAHCSIAQEKIRTDAEQDGFAGLIRSVSTSATRSDVRWAQPGGPTLLVPIWCSECEYAADGNRTKSGSNVDGKFWGELIRLVRDGDGHVTDRFVTMSTGELVRHQVMGPFGRTEEFDFQDKKLHWRQTFSYDQYGHVTDWSTFDGKGKAIGHTHTETTRDGTVTERSVWGENGELSWQQTFDPESDVEHFTTFDASGKVQLTKTVIKGKPAHFWEAPASSSQYGDSFSEDVGENDRDQYDCHSNGLCDRFRIHYEYLNSDKRLPLSAEWRDADGKLLYAAYYQYEIDAQRNWTHRQVWVFSGDLGKRSLYETDSRTITYWPDK